MNEYNYVLRRVLRSTVNLCVKIKKKKKNYVYIVKYKQPVIVRRHFLYQKQGITSVTIEPYLIFTTITYRATHTSALFFRRLTTEHERTFLNDVTAQEQYQYDVNKNEGTSVRRTTSVPAMVEFISQ